MEADQSCFIKMFTFAGPLHFGTESVGLAGVQRKKEKAYPGILSVLNYHKGQWLVVDLFCFDCQ